MKAFVAAVASLAASSQAQVLINPYAGVPQGQLAYAGYAGAPLAYAGAPLAYAGAPITTIAAAPAPVATVAAIPAAPLSQQFHSQDEFTNFAHGYSNLHSSKTETGNAALGIVSGGYSYVDANGELQTTQYQADALGFRVQATNLPVAPVFEGKAPVFNPELPVAPVYNGVAPVFNPVLPVAPALTPEVAEATAAHLAAHEEAGDRKKRSTPAATEPLVVKALPAPAFAPLTYGGYAGYAPFHGAYAPYHGAYAPYHGAYAPFAAAPYVAAPVAPVAAPVATVAAPGAAEATLTKVKLNPGHAIAYRVD